MAAEKENMEKSANKDAKSPWLLGLALVTIVFSVGLVTVTVIMYMDLHNLDETDARVMREIEALRIKLEVTRMNAGLPVEIEEAQEAPAADKANPDEREIRHVNKRIQPTNFFQAFLHAQESVFESYCHSRNSTCPTGTTGEKGVIGDTGAIGLIGASGTVGPKGVIGDTGPRGYAGLAGDKGAAGQIGAAGPRGPVGLKGLKGDPGPNGPVGLTGLAGAKGTKGVKGDLGAAGPRGLQGTTGLKGHAGDTGDRGPKGLQGDAGPQGIKGNSTEKLGNRCECLKTPTFRDEVYSYRAHAQRSLDTLCEASGNPQPDVTVKRVPDSSQTDADEMYECTATNMVGTATKYVMFQTPN